MCKLLCNFLKFGNKQVIITTHLSVCDEIDEFVQLMTSAAVHPENALTARGQSVKTDRHVKLRVTTDDDHTTLQTEIDN
jgi:L-lysine 2,3-aminomutase